jgi:non-specific serine/threonine protein kinase/serine/threonine-protein kinase
MGDVYRARDTRLNRTVAIKVRARQFVAHPAHREQFAREAQAVSALNHPRICLLHDVGRHEGIDFLVMEYVEGEPIDDYCNRRRLSLRQRLLLFCKVCEAVQYAHQHLIVHRDLKPANILVTADGQPKLLDFGVAKLLDTSAAGRTPTLSPMLTPEYASPEQVRGEAVTTGTDVYSLGIVLYELLVGRRPYVIRTTSLEDIVHAVCDTDIMPPSAAVRELRGQPTVPARASRELRGDLDTIVLHALRKEPERRYRSVQALADDIACFLGGQPVAARGDALTYRLTKFFARHRTAVVVGALCLVALVASMTAILRQSQIADLQRQRAERRFADVRKLAGSFLFEFHDAIEHLPGSTRARQLVTTRALQYLDSLEEESGDDPTLRAELARAYRQVADILGGFRAANLGDLAGALTSYRKALSLQEPLAAARPHDRAIRQDLARTLLAVGDVQLMMNDGAAALDSFRRGLSIHQDVAASGAVDRAAQRELAIGHYRVGHAQEELGDLEAADSSLRRSISLLATLAADATDTESRHALARSYKRLGMVRALMHDYTGNLAMEESALRLIESVAAADPLNMVIRNEVAMTHLELGRAQIRLRRFGEALSSVRRAEAITAAMAAADADNVQARWMRGLELNLIGDILRQMRRPGEAVTYHLQALALLETLARADPAHENYHYNVANTRQLIADAYVVMAHGQAAAAARSRAWREARSWYGKSADAFDAMRQRGTLTAAYVADAERVAAGLALSTRALAALSP